MSTWQILDVRSIWIKEFAFALSRLVPIVNWQPRMRWTGAWQNWMRVETHANPALEIHEFPLQRGYADPLISSILPFASKLIRVMSAHPDQAGDSTLVTTTPFYAPVAEQWRGPVIYYQTDLTVAYAGIDAKVARAMDRRMCAAASLVCPNSTRIAAYMVEQAGCDESKITVVPNATRQANIYDRCPPGPASLPADIAHLRRPLAGVIGNLAANMDWEFLLSLVGRTPAMTWLFVGPFEMPIVDRAQRHARRELLARGGNVFFTGSRSYADLQAYARCLDVAVLPYRSQEPTYSGSSTRFYEHLAACRPMIATRGFAELLEKEPLLQLADSADDAAGRISRLESQDFCDGHAEERWLASMSGTWERRAAAMIAALADRVKA